MTSFALAAALETAPPAKPTYREQIAATIPEIAHTITRKPAIAHKVLVAAAIGEIVIDTAQTVPLRGCTELDPIARPFVHSEPIAIAATGLVAFAITRAPNRPFWNAVLGAFVGGEAFNIARNARVRC